MNMQRQIHRLERLIQSKDNEAKQLTARNRELEKRLTDAFNQIQTLKSQAKQSFSYGYVPDRQMIKTMEAKMASTTWQIQQLQRMNTKYQETIIKLQAQLIAREQEIGIKRHQLEEVQSVPHHFTIQDNNYASQLRELEDAIREKENLIQENLLLKNRVKSMETERTEKMKFYLDEVMSLTTKIKNQQLNEKSRLTQMQSLVKELRKQNDSLRQTLHSKNEQLVVFYSESKLITTDKASDLHTIKNLRKEIRKRGEQFHKILLKLQQTQQLKQKMMQYNATCAQTMGEFDKIMDKYDKAQRQLGILKQKLAYSEQQKGKLQTTIDDANKKLYELLTQNQVCHQLLRETRGYSQLYCKDIQQKLEGFLRGLDKRRENSQSWRNVSELITVNQRLRANWNTEERLL